MVSNQDNASAAQCDDDFCAATPQRPCSASPNATLPTPRLRSASNYAMTGITGPAIRNDGPVPFFGTDDPIPFLPSEEMAVWGGEP